MVKMTMQVSEDFAERIQPMSQWLPTIIEVGLVGFKTIATAAGSELITFLAQNPTPAEVLDYHVSTPSQARLQRLLTLNESGLLSESEK